jgi:beta-galactosidase
MVSFVISGEGFIAGVDNGSQISHESFKADHRNAFNGMCLAVVQATEKKGKITFKAFADGLQESEMEILVR